MAQGTRVTGNLCYANTTDDLFVEVNHGPFVVDDNLLLSETALRDWSQGGAYAHNLFAGDLIQQPERDRETPYHEARSTELAGLRAIQGGDDRFYNNVFVGGTGLAPYDDAERPVWMAGNAFLDGAEPSAHESGAVVSDAGDVELVEDGEGVALTLDVGDALDAGGPRDLVTTDLLGRAAVPDLPFTAPDGSPLRIDADYAGDERDDDPAPGPFARPGTGRVEVRVWPR
jgi:alpha-N-arabinofuranosidase